MDVIEFCSAGNATRIKLLSRNKFRLFRLWIPNFILRAARFMEIANGFAALALNSHEIVPNLNVHIIPPVRLMHICEDRMASFPITRAARYPNFFTVRL